MHYSQRDIALRFAAKTVWLMPGKFQLARTLGRYTLRCILFHDVSETETWFTKGLDVTVSPQRFESALQFLSTHYSPVSLQQVLSDPEGQNLPPRPVLVTFDDCYASVAENAAPLCRKYGVPAVFFVNAACLDHKQWAIDNIVCYVVNSAGLSAVRDVAAALTRHSNVELNSMAEIFSDFLPGLSLEQRARFHEILASRIAGGPDVPLAKNLYLATGHIRKLAASGFEIGNHTYTHVHCRRLARHQFGEEIDKNKAALQAASQSEVRSFSVPYGRSADLTGELLEHLAQSGHQAVFLSESVANGGRRCLEPQPALRLDRVSARATGDAYLFAEVEVFPRLRAIRNGLVSRN